VPTVTIDNIQVEVEQGATILDAANKAGVWIPTLCLHPAIEPQASCRICMVELDRGQWKQLVTACNYPVRGDITISVSSENAVKARRGVMEFILARAPDNKQLKAIAERMGVYSTPWPTVTTTQRDCILCGLCTAVCDEVLGLASIGFSGRGVERAVVAPFRQAPDNCIACGACEAVCPVGTIQIRVHEDTDEIEISPFKARAKIRKCESCGARIASELTVAAALQNIDNNLEKLRDLAKLCPNCRRTKTAESLTDKAVGPPTGK
jgi:bidirectional [NiFe] hydrogenase diaphorase subunit